MARQSLARLHLSIYPSTRVRPPLPPLCSGGKACACVTRVRSAQIFEPSPRPLAPSLLICIMLKWLYGIYRRRRRGEAAPGEAKWPSMRPGAGILFDRRVR